MGFLGRQWLRRIALGLPIIVPMLTSCAERPGGCLVNEFAAKLTRAEADRLVAPDGGVSQQSCLEECERVRLSADAGFGPRLEPAIACELNETAEGPELRCEMPRRCFGGRAPSGLQPATLDGAGIGKWLAGAAHLEAASIDAFRELSAELTMHRAPVSWITAAERAAIDEARHARQVAALASRYGAVTPEVRRTRIKPRSLLEMARDNAIEGCVREAYAALLASAQSARATDLAVRQTYLAIAKDEAHHALLSFAIHDWVKSKACARDRRSLEEVRHAALDALLTDLEHEPEPDLVTSLGLPRADAALQLARSLA